MYFMLILIVASLTILLPRFVPYIARKYGIEIHSAPVWLPVMAAVLYLSSLYLPDIGITEETNTFQQHFVGGGVYTALLFIYFSKLLNWRLNFGLTFLALYAWTSALGVFNEVLEFALNELEITRINTADTDWDLFANTAGAITAFLLWQIIEYLRRSR